MARFVLRTVATMRMTVDLRTGADADSHQLAAMPGQLAPLSGEVLRWLPPVLCGVSKLTSKNLQLAIGR